MLQEIKKADEADPDLATCWSRGSIRRIIEGLPTIEAAPVVHGRWVDARSIPSVNRKDVPVVKCSKCKIYFCDLINNHHYMYHYCPNCGARMDGDAHA